MRNSAWRSTVVSVLTVALVNLGFVSVAGAGMIDTAALVHSTREADLAAVQARLDRQDVQRQLQEMGVDAATVQNRIARLSDHELHRLAQEMETAPAGGDFLAVVGVVFVVLIILEFVGVIDVFKRAP